jgi:hypothetical protein
MLVWSVVVAVFWADLSDSGGFPLKLVFGPYGEDLWKRAGMEFRFER